MEEKTRRRPSPATAIAIVALIIAMTGSAGAAIKKSAPAPSAPLTYTNLTLMNNWSAYGGGTRTPSAAKDANGIVHLRGAMGQNPAGSDQAMVLPSKFRPSGYVYVPVDMCDSANGRIIIYPTGEVYVQAEVSQSSAQCFTSLEGVSYAKN